jgi:hypothetical protein
MFQPDFADLCVSRYRWLRVSQRGTTVASRNKHVASASVALIARSCPREAEVLPELAPSQWAGHADARAAGRCVQEKSVAGLPPRKYRGKEAFWALGVVETASDLIAWAILLISALARVMDICSVIGPRGGESTVNDSDISCTKYS